jgi:sugar phosphate isomerase/epimerase
MTSLGFLEEVRLLGWSSEIDYPAIVGTLKEIGCGGWIVLETSSPSKDLVADTRTNLQYVQKLFAARG